MLILQGMQEWSKTVGEVESHLPHTRTGIRTHRGHKLRAEHLAVPSGSCSLQNVYSEIRVEFTMIQLCCAVLQVAHSDGRAHAENRHC